MNLDDLVPEDRHDLRTLLRDLEARAAEAEARATAEASRAAAEASRANAAEDRARVEAAKSKELAEKLKASEVVVGVLMRRLGLLTSRLASLRGGPEQVALELEMAAIQRQLDELNREKFGAKSERRAPSGKDKPAPKPKTGHGPTAQPKLPKTHQRHLLEGCDRKCPTCDVDMAEWAGRTDDSEEITVVERTYQIVVHQKQVYRCACGHLETALGPPRLVPGGRYAPELAVAVATDKYRDAIPLTRQVERMAESGLDVTSQTLWDQLTELYVVLLPSYLALQKRILASELVHADETPWRLMQKGGTKRWWVWALSDGLRAFFLFAPTRGSAAARELLLDYAGVVMADRYSVYESLEKARTKNGGKQSVLFVDDACIELPTPDYTLVACWMHARRGFIRAARNGETDANDALDLIAELYAIESRATVAAAHESDPARRTAALLDARRALRNAESKPIIAKLLAWSETVRTSSDLPLADAIRWMHNGWIELTRFLTDARVPLDNGLAERLIRGLVVGRKVYAGARSALGTQVAALFYSLIESCRLARVDARAYLLEAVRRALEDRDVVFLPEDFAVLTTTAEAAE